MRFMTWLRRQRNRDDPIGDLARDTLRIEKWELCRRMRDLREVKNYMASRPYDTRAAGRALRDAEREFEAES